MQGDWLGLLFFFFFCGGDEVDAFLACCVRFALRQCGLGFPLEDGDGGGERPREGRGREGRGEEGLRGRCGGRV